MRTIIPVALLALASCATYKVKGATDFTRPLLQTDVFLVEMASDDSIEGERLSLIRAVILQTLKENGLQYTTNHTASTITLNARVASVNRVDPGMQNLVGVAAGRPKYEVAVSLVDVKSLQPIGSFTILGKASSHAPNDIQGRPSTEEAMAQAARGIAGVLLEHRE